MQYLLTLWAGTAAAKFEITVSLSPTEWLFIEKQMIPNSATHLEVATQLLCDRTKPEERAPLLSLLAKFWEHEVPKETMENLLKFLDCYYRKECDTARTRVRSGYKSQERSHIAWWVGRATATKKGSPASSNKTESPLPHPASIMILGEKLQQCILLRDYKWLQDLGEFLKELPRNPVLGDALKDMLPEMQRPGGSEGKKREILDEFQKHIKKYRRLPTVGELNEACDLDKDNALRYRKELGLSGLPKTRRTRKS